MIRRPPRSTLFPTRRSSDLGKRRSERPASRLRQNLLLRRASAVGRAASDRRANAGALGVALAERSEEHTSELQSQFHLVCRLLLEKKKQPLPIRERTSNRAD